MATTPIITVHASMMIGNDEYRLGFVVTGDDMRDKHLFAALMRSMTLTADSLKVAA